jgi:hypothetical protein
MIEHKLFPTLLTEFHYPDKDKFKEKFVKNIFKYCTPEGHSSEATGHVNLHHEKQFEGLFKFATQSAKQYVERLNIDSSKFDFNIIKTWMNIKKNAATPTHSHGDAHVSFTYYINMPPNCSLPIRFHNHATRHEPYPGSIRHNNTKQIWDELNSETWLFTPKEGQMFVFPASFPHDTIGEPFMQLESGITKQNILQHRLCLAGDILLTYKQKTASHLGVQPVSNWRNFE